MAKQAELVPDTKAVLVTGASGLIRPNRSLGLARRHTSSTSLLLMPCSKDSSLRRTVHP